MGRCRVLWLLVAWVVASGEACIGRSKSQFNEEQTLIDKFGWAEKYDGVYVEIGALDGYRLSNTLKLHSCYKWRGVLVEGSQINFDALVQNVAEYRPGGRVRMEYGAVCQPPKTHVWFALQKERDPNSYIIPGSVAGDLDVMDEKFKTKWGNQYEGRVETPCHPMSYYLRDTPHVDFFSLDVESAEPIVLQTMNMGNTTVDVWLVEMDTSAKMVRDFFSTQPYVECDKFTIRHSAVFVRKGTRYIPACSSVGERRP